MRLRVVALALVFAAGCRDLPAIDEGVCGNGVVERSAGEDCDRFATTAGSVCRQPGETFQCRYDCSLRDDGTRPTCPAGMGCALDGVCRWGSGRFEKTGTTSVGSPRELLVADLDGDRRDDLIAAERDRTLVHYYGDQGVPSGLLSIPDTNDSGTAPLVHELSGDGLPDLVVPYASGIVASLGSKDREAVPTAYSTLALPDGVDDAYYISIDVLPQNPGRETLLLAAVQGLAAGALVKLDAKQLFQLVTVTLPPADLAGDVAVGNVFEDPVQSPCDDLVFPFRGQPTLVAFTPCKLDPASGEIALNQNGTSIEIALPSGDTVEGPLVLTDFDHDGHLDVAVGATDGKQHFIDRAFGLGDGTFDSKSPVGASADGQAARAGNLGATPALAIGDFDRDGEPDYVDAHGAYLQRPSGFETVASSGADTWSEAVIADFNGNGMVDVFAATKDAPGASFFNGIGNGKFAPFSVASVGPLSHLAVGDYDGDLIFDVAAAERASNRTGDLVSVMFGNTSGAPAAAQQMGLLGEVTQLTTSRSSPEGEPDWAVDDITSVSLSPGQAKAFAGFGGRGDRQLRAPYVPVSVQQDEFGTAGVIPLRLAAGRFDDDDHADLAELCDTHDLSGNDTMRLWLVPMHDQAGVLVGDARLGSPLPPGDYAHAEMTAGDLDGDHIDEVVLLVPDADPNGGALAYAAKPQKGADGFWQWDLGSPAALSWRFEQREDLQVPGGDPGGGRVRIADVDADTHADVVALAPASGDNPAALVVFHGDGSAQLGTPSVVPDTPDGPATAFALIQADRDPALELLLLAGSHAYIANLGPKGSYKVGTTPVAELDGAGLAAAGDFDGDGVADIALGSASSVAVYLGLPGIR